ncbi:MAG: hypothetical protein IJS56_06275 [Bacilli bacterium]|nr:hypothetical protein [Bacilli bacterium]
MENNTLKELVSYYISVLEEAFSITKDHSITNLKRISKFKDDIRIKEKYYKELNDYYDSLKVDLDVIKFLIFNQSKLNEDNIYHTLNRLDSLAESKYNYIDSIIDLLDISCDLELPEKFYIPKKNFRYMNKEELINIAKGFTMNSVKDFLVNEKVYNNTSFDTALGSVKYFNLVGGETKYIAGVFEKGIVLPRVRDDLTTLIAIHELVHNSILMNKESINDKNIVYSEILPRFYENLYASQNGFIKETIHKDEYTDILLNDYHKEPMMVQVEKVRRLIN